MKKTIKMRQAHRTPVVKSCVGVILLSMVTVGAAFASDGQLSATLQAARCLPGKIEEAYKSDAIAVFKVDCEGPGNRQLTITCTRSTCSAASARGEDKDDES
ncbi:conserved exported hypothetical protein [Bosea sp. 62]|uniref:hypothetical protein n=1 Tax=unclassified Bosea (in: a-proteobacteria) TaxID=2653178 RepID=UPI0012588B12|nr:MULTISPECIES: hypothetical protein [unclassified Bosea (in: a-proteobacteria)]CAD5291583.1 conserved exported hypothetical protein [Bosea sp. 21B]CAD5292704.1 conserved exported hypothetical protein [Bosea sp. 46]CAD5300057.1 conserved exported hypothetical protein [Bosea sp. 7B]VVT57161.1 conserved exported hypothetical protein [Bosea sp. EC-HK365B]VXB50114.1 conserved exported hypothetical protein [Bosea sp. 127]